MKKEKAKKIKSCGGDGKEKGTINPAIITIKI